MIIGITGKSGSGKSTVCKSIELRFKWHVIDVDIIHKYFAEQENEKIIEIFKNKGYDCSNPELLIKIFFEEEELRKEVNSILFPLVYDKVQSLIVELQKTYTVIVLDAPLLFDIGLDKLCGLVGMVTCELYENINRLMKRNNINQLDALARYHAINFSGKHIDFYIHSDKE